MKCPGFRCEKTRTLAVVWGWDGALSFPSVFYGCEVCVDHVCSHLERGDWSNGTPPSYIVVIDDDPTLNMPCRANVDIPR